MIDRKDVIIVTLPDPYRKIADYHASQCTMGGSKSIPQGKFTQAENDTWNRQGQYGECAINYLIFGDIVAYNSQREKMNAGKTNGDGGSDVPGYQIDVKTHILHPGHKLVYQQVRINYHDIKGIGRSNFDRGLDTLYVWAFVTIAVDKVKLYFTGSLTYSEIISSIWGNDSQKMYYIPVRYLNPVNLSKEALANVKHK